MSIRQTIIDTMNEVAGINEITLVHPLSDDIVLLECGLDSMGFAVLVAQLEEQLQFDPFTMTDEPIYPETLGKFIQFYEAMSAHK